MNVENGVRGPGSTALAYSSMEECCATNAVMKVRVFLSEHHDDLAQLAEGYSDIIEDDSSNLSVMTNWFVTQLERVPVFYTGSCEFESHRANKG